MFQHKKWFILALLALACGVGEWWGAAGPTPTPTVIVAAFATATPGPTMVVERPGPTPTLTSTPTPTVMVSPTTAATATPTAEPADTPAPAPVTQPAATAPPPAATAMPTPAPAYDFLFRYVRLRNNQENSWDGTIGPGACGSDHSIYVHVADAQQNLLDGVLIGDKFGNFEVPTGVDGPGAVRILVWTATMELAVLGHQDGTRYTSQFTPPLSTLDEQIPIPWLQQAGYCQSNEDCRWRVDNNQLCRGHYSYDVIFQRTW